MYEAAHNQPGTPASAAPVRRTWFEHDGSTGGGEHGRSVIVQENLAKLAMTEVGRHLTPTYLAAIDTEPRFEGTILVPYETDDIPELADAGGAARAPHCSASARPEVAINVDDWGAWNKMTRRRKVSIREIALKIGMDAADIGPKEYAVFAFLHEFGHVRDYIDKDFDPNMIDEEREEGLGTLPAPGLPPSQLSAWGRSHPFRAWAYMVTNRQRLKALGVSSFKELLAAQEIAYRHIPDEAFADRFAADMIQRLDLLAT